MTLPASAERTLPPAGQPAKPAFSRDFMKASIETMSEIREWRSALLIAVENGYKMTESGWIITVRRPARTSAWHP